MNRDVLVTLFTKELGKMATMAKGVKKITSRRLPHIQTGNFITALISISNDRYYLQSSELKSSFSAIKSDPAKIEKMYAFFFVLERLLPEHQVETRTYQLLLSFLVNLSKESFEERELMLFFNRLMKILGYTDQNLTLPEIRLKVEELIHDNLPSFGIMG